MPHVILPLVYLPSLPLKLGHLLILLILGELLARHLNILVSRDLLWDRITLAESRVRLHLLDELIVGVKGIWVQKLSI